MSIFPSSISSSLKLVSALALLGALTLSTSCSSTSPETRDGTSAAATTAGSAPDCGGAATQKVLTYCVSPAAAEYARSMETFKQQMRAGNPSIETFPLPVEGAHVKGSDEAAVTIVVFTDLECPTCANFHKQLEGLQKKYSTNLRLVYRHFPLPQHTQAEPAARAAIAAGEQGKFWEFVHEAYARQGSLSDATFEAIVKDIGGDVAAWKTSYAKPEHKARIKRDMARGEALGLSYTPYAFINGVVLPPQALTEEQLSSFIDGQVTIAKAFKAAGVPGKEVYWRLVKANFDSRAMDEAKARREQERKDRVPVYVPVDGSPSKGASADKALVTIIEFSDFECPFCSRANEPLMRAVAKHKDTVRVVFKHFPLPFHKRADDASALSIVAHKQGKFWEAHDLLFANQRALEDEDLTGYAKQLGLTSDNVLAAMRGDAVRGILERDVALGSKLGVNGTPTMFFNGQRQSGALPFEQLDTTLTREVELARSVQQTTKLSGEALYKAVIDTKAAALK